MIGGRNGWVAWPVALLCAGAVAGLVWLALPAVPAAVQLGGDLLRSGTAARATPVASSPSITPVSTPTGEVAGCHDLYPRDLWARLRARAGAEPTASLTAATRPDGAPTVVTDLTCRWQDAAAGRVSTTLSTVADPAALREAFEADGAVCTPEGAGVRCEAADGDVVRVDALQGRLWLSTTMTRWHPLGYADAVAAQVWG